MGDLKQVIVARKDIGMSPGKLGAQVGHAVVLAYDNARSANRAKWKQAGMTKVVLQVPDEGSLLAIYQAAIAAGLPCSLVCDEGRTELAPSTHTCVGIGPAEAQQIDSITGSLKLY
jgi:PTH2 family peptidyl-tRNA hydrolase